MTVGLRRDPAEDDVCMTESILVQELRQTLRDALIKELPKFSELLEKHITEGLEQLVNNCQQTLSTGASAGEGSHLRSVVGTRTEHDMEEALRAVQATTTLPPAEKKQVRVLESTVTRVLREGTMDTDDGEFHQMPVGARVSTASSWLDRHPKPFNMSGHLGPEYDRISSSSNMTDAHGGRRVRAISSNLEPIASALEVSMPVGTPSGTMNSSSGNNNSSNNNGNNNSNSNNNNSNNNSNGNSGKAGGRNEGSGSGGDIGDHVSLSPTMNTLKRLVRAPIQTFLRPRPPSLGPPELPGQLSPDARTLTPQKSDLNTSQEESDDGCDGFSHVHTPNVAARPTLKPFNRRRSAVEAYIPRMNSSGTDFLSRWEYFREQVGTFMGQPSFDYFVAFIVTLNAAVVGLSVNTSMRDDSSEDRVLHNLEVFFLVVFSLEVLLRMIAFGRDFFVGPRWSWNMFDLSCLIFEICEELIVYFERNGAYSNLNATYLRSMHLLRAVRVIRNIRLLRLVGEFRTLLVSLRASLRNLIWTVCLMAFLTYNMAVLLTQLALELNQKATTGLDSTGAGDIHDLYGDLPSSMHTLFQAVTGGMDWKNAVDPLMTEVSPAVGLLFDAYIAFMFFAMLNNITGVFVESALRCAKEENDLDMIDNVRQIFTRIGTGSESKLSPEEFEKQASSKAMKGYFKEIDVDPSEARQIFQVLDLDGSGFINAEEFLSGCLRLRGPARALDLALLRHELRHVQQSLSLRKTSLSLGGTAGHHTFQSFASGPRRKSQGDTGAFLLDQNLGNLGNPARDTRSSQVNSVASAKMASNTASISSSNNNSNNNNNNNTYNNNVNINVNGPTSDGHGDALRDDPSPLRALGTGGGGASLLPPQGQTSGIPPSTPSMAARFLEEAQIIDLPGELGGGATPTTTTPSGSIGQGGGTITALSTAAPGGSTNSLSGEANQRQSAGGPDELHMEHQELARVLGASSSIATPTGASRPVEHTRTVT